MQGTLSKSEWEVLTMYKVFAFQKTPQSTAATTKEEEKEIDGIVKEDEKK